MLLYDDRGQYLKGPQIPLATRKGNQIPNEQQLLLSKQELEDARAFVLENRRQVRVRSLSNIYNCMGMVFASRRTWIHPNYLEMILEEDEYRLLSDVEELERGDIAVYRDGEGKVSHVGIVAEAGLYAANGQRQVMVLSQWGQAGEFFHSAEDVNPWLGTLSEYWTDRT